MTKPRDMSVKQFEAACEKRGIAPKPDLMGYHRVTGEPGGSGLRVCALNAGTNRRRQLAYLIKAQDRAHEEDRQRDENDAALKRHVGERRESDPRYVVYSNCIRFSRMELSLSESVAIINALRELRGKP